jgi:hypothetical protein
LRDGAGAATLPLYLGRGGNANSPGVSQPPPPTVDRTVVARENSKPGNPDWLLSSSRLPSSSLRAAPPSTACPGAAPSISMSISPILPPPSIFFEWGWYGGALARLVTSIGRLAGVLQPSPTERDPQTHLLECTGRVLTRSRYRTMPVTRSTGAREHTWHGLLQTW